MLEFKKSTYPAKTNYRYSTILFQSILFHFHINCALFYGYITYCAYVQCKVIPGSRPEMVVEAIWCIIYAFVFGTTPSRPHHLTALLTSSTIYLTIVVLGTQIKFYYKCFHAGLISWLLQKRVNYNCSRPSTPELCRWKLTQIA